MIRHFDGKNEKKIVIAFIWRTRYNMINSQTIYAKIWTTSEREQSRIMPETLKQVFAGEIERENEQNKKLETLTVEWWSVEGSIKLYSATGFQMRF